MNVFGYVFLTLWPTKGLLTQAAESGLSEEIWVTLRERNKRRPLRLIEVCSAKSKRCLRGKIGESSVVKSGKGGGRGTEGVDIKGKNRNTFWTLCEEIDEALKVI